ncbi:MFS transporter [Nocardia wallacei]|uniref:MFS transporter n=1 Tax=Nocardia wallacei TaxID=480035 RepID=UPI00245703BB|nr:MFS transporter [Nocardia wallacei]
MQSPNYGGANRRDNRGVPPSPPPSNRPIVQEDLEPCRRDEKALELGTRAQRRGKKKQLNQALVNLRQAFADWPVEHHLGAAEAVTTRLLRTASSCAATRVQYAGQGASRWISVEVVDRSRAVPQRDEPDERTGQVTRTEAGQITDLIEKTPLASWDCRMYGDGRRSRRLWYFASAQAQNPTTVESPPLFRITLQEREIERLGELKNAIADKLRRTARLSEDEVWSVRTAVSELATNACKYAGGVDIAGWLLNDRLVVDFEDSSAELPTWNLKKPKVSSEEDLLALFTLDDLEAERSDPNSLGDRAEGNHGRGARIVLEDAEWLGILKRDPGKVIRVVYRVSPPTTGPATAADGHPSSDPDPSPSIPNAASDRSAPTRPGFDGPFGIPENPFDEHGNPLNRRLSPANRRALLTSYARVEASGGGFPRRRRKPDETLPKSGFLQWVRNRAKPVEDTSEKGKVSVRELHVVNKPFVTLLFGDAKLPGGDAFSQIGSSAASTAIPLILLNAGESPTAAAMAGAALWIPRSFELFAGYVADFWDQKKVMVSALGGGGAAAATATGLIIFDAPDLAVGLTAAALVEATAATFYTRTFYTAARKLLTSAEQDAGNGLLTSTRSAAQVTGNSLAGLASAVPAAPAGLNTLSFLGQLANVRRFPFPARSHPNSTSQSSKIDRKPLKAIHEGWRALRQNQFLSEHTVAATITNAAWAMMTFRTTTVLADADMSVWADGAVLAAPAVGGVLGGLLMPKLIDRIPIPIPISGLFAAGLTSIAGSHAIQAATADPSLIAATSFVEMMVTAGVNTRAATYQQQTVPEELQGRVGSVRGLFLGTGPTVGLLAGGAVAGTHGGDAVAALAATVAAVTAAGYGALHLVRKGRVSLRIIKRGRGWFGRSEREPAPVQACSLPATPSAARQTRQPAGIPAARLPSLLDDFDPDPDVFDLPLPRRKSPRPAAGGPGYAGLGDMAPGIGGATWFRENPAASSADPIPPSPERHPVAEVELRSLVIDADADRAAIANQASGLVHSLVDRDDSSLHQSWSPELLGIAELMADELGSAVTNNSHAEGVLVLTALTTGDGAALAFDMRVYGTNVARLNLVADYADRYDLEPVADGYTVRAVLADDRRGAAELVAALASRDTRVFEQYGRAVGESTAGRMPQYLRAHGESLLAFLSGLPSDVELTNSEIEPARIRLTVTAAGLPPADIHQADPTEPEIDDLSAAAAESVELTLPTTDPAADSRIGIAIDEIVPGWPVTARVAATDAVHAALSHMLGRSVSSDITVRVDSHEGLRVTVAHDGIPGPSPELTQTLELRTSAWQVLSWPEQLHGGPAHQRVVLDFHLFDDSVSVPTREPAGQAHDDQLPISEAFGVTPLPKSVTALTNRVRNLLGQHGLAPGDVGIAMQIAKELSPEVMSPAARCEVRLSRAGLVTLDFTEGDEATERQWGAVFRPTGQDTASVEVDADPVAADAWRRAHREMLRSGWSTARHVDAARAVVLSQVSEFQRWAGEPAWAMAVRVSGRPQHRGLHITATDPRHQNTVSLVELFEQYGDPGPNCTATEHFYDNRWLARWHWERGTGSPWADPLFDGTEIFPPLAGRPSASRRGSQRLADPARRSGEQRAELLLAAGLHKRGRNRQAATLVERIFSTAPDHLGPQKTRRNAERLILQLLESLLRPVASSAERTSTAAEARSDRDVLLTGAIAMGPEGLELRVIAAVHRSSSSAGMTHEWQVQDLVGPGRASRAGTESWGGFTTTWIAVPLRTGRDIEGGQGTGKEASARAGAGGTSNPARVIETIDALLGELPPDNGNRRTATPEPSQLGGAFPEAGALSTNSTASSTLTPWGDRRSDQPARGLRTPWSADRAIPPVGEPPDISDALDIPLPRRKSNRPGIGGPGFAGLGDMSPGVGGATWFRENPDPGKTNRDVNSAIALLPDPPLTQQDRKCAASAVAKLRNQFGANAIPQSLVDRIPPANAVVAARNRVQQNAQWWFSLADDEQMGMIAVYPALIGNTDGIPYADRDNANRRSISRQLANLENIAQHRKLNAEERAHRLNLATARNHLTEIQRRVQKFGSPPVQLLSYDAQKYNGQGRIAVSIGDADRAANVTRHVGGFGTTLRKLLHRYNFAEAQYEVTSRYAPDEIVAAVIDIGYEHPTKLVMGTSPILPFDPAYHRFAEVGGYVVARDIASYNATRTALAEYQETSLPRLHTLLGHSYGTTTICYAGQHGRLAREIDQVVLTASPGAGPITHAAEFGIGTENVYVLTATHDPIAWLGAETPDRRGRFLNRGLGVDPANEAWGAVRVTTESPDTPELRNPLRAHTAYDSFADRENLIPTESLNNIGLITAGRGAEATRAEHRTTHTRRRNPGQLSDPDQRRRVRIRALSSTFPPEAATEIEQIISELSAVRDANGNRPFAYLDAMPLPTSHEPFGADWASNRHDWFRTILTGNFAELRNIELTDKDIFELKRILRRAPIYLTIALAVTAGLKSEQLVGISDSGPLFFKQEKRIQGDKTITVWKFRSMALDEPEQPSSRDIANRVSPMRRFVRATSLDELPQLLSIATGTMSYLQGRPMLDGDRARMREVLTPAEYDLWDQHLKNDLWSALHFPGCRSLDPESTAYLRTRYLAARLYSLIGSRSVDNYVLGVVDRYLLGMVSAEGRVLARALAASLRDRIAPNLGARPGLSDGGDSAAKGTVMETDPDTFGPAEANTSLQPVRSGGTASGRTPWSQGQGHIDRSMPSLDLLDALNPAADVFDSPLPRPKYTRPGAGGPGYAGLGEMSPGVGGATWFRENPVRPQSGTVIHPAANDGTPEVWLTGTYQGQPIMFRSSDVWSRPLTDADGIRNGVTFCRESENRDIQWAAQESRLADTEIFPVRLYSSSTEVSSPDDALWAANVRKSGRLPNFFFLHGTEDGDYFIVNINRGTKTEEDWVEVELSGRECGRMLEANKDSKRALRRDPAADHVLAACHTGDRAALLTADYLHSTGNVTGIIYAALGEVFTEHPDDRVDTGLYVVGDISRGDLFKAYHPPILDPSPSSTIANCAIDVARAFQALNDGAQPDPDDTDSRWDADDNWRMLETTIGAQLRPIKIKGAGDIATIAEEIRAKKDAADTAVLVLDDGKNAHGLLLTNVEDNVFVFDAHRLRNFDGDDQGNKWQRPDRTIKKAFIARFATRNGSLIPVDKSKPKLLHSKHPHKIQGTSTE